ncbi:MAG: QueT transporter family protein [Candidatus Polarisedimenticolia bacterium]
MRELFTMWRDTRMVVLTSVLAALHAAAVIPFKPIQILPGVTDLRPGMALPIVFSLLFGPPAAWGAAIGNTISDLFGTLGPGTLFGFLGNLLYGYVPWRVWTAWRRGPARLGTPVDWGVFLLGLAGASGACALTIGWGVHMLNLYPFASTAGIILMHNLTVGLILSPPLLAALRHRVARLNMLMEEPEEGNRFAAARLSRKASSLFFVAACGAGLAAGYASGASGASDAAITGAVTPFVAAVLLAAVLL